jgi:hypothetical protein
MLKEHQEGTSRSCDLLYVRSGKSGSQLLAKENWFMATPSFAGNSCSPRADDIVLPCGERNAGMGWEWCCEVNTAPPLAHKHVHDTHIQRACAHITPKRHTRVKSKEQVRQSRATNTGRRGSQECIGQGAKATGKEGAMVGRHEIGAYSAMSK